MRDITRRESSSDRASSPGSIQSGRESHVNWRVAESRAAPQPSFLYSPWPSSIHDATSSHAQRWSAGMSVSAESYAAAAPAWSLDSCNASPTSASHHHGVPRQPRAAFTAAGRRRSSTR